MSYLRRSKAVAITKEQMTTNPSLVHWRTCYASAIPAFRALQADTTTSSSTTTTTSNSSNPDDAADAVLTDDDIVRILAEWAGDIDLAVAKHREAQAWRRSYFPIPRSDVLRTLQTQKIIFHGFDRVGRPVCYYRTRLHDPKAFTPEETGAWMWM